MKKPAESFSVPVDLSQDGLVNRNANAEFVEACQCIEQALGFLLGQGPLRMAASSNPNVLGRRIPFDSALARKMRSSANSIPAFRRIASEKVSLSAGLMAVAKDRIGCGEGGCGNGQRNRPLAHPRKGASDRSPET
jgi:hypothetical protein